MRPSPTVRCPRHSRCVGLLSPWAPAARATVRHAPPRAPTVALPTHRLTPLLRSPARWPARAQTAFAAEGLKLGKRRKPKRVPRPKVPKVPKAPKLRKARTHKVKPAVLRAAYEALAEGGWDIFDAVAKRGHLTTDHLKQLAIHKGVYEG